MNKVGRIGSILAATFASAVFALVSAQSISADDPELTRLQREWAVRFLEPVPHMELAKYFRAKGNRIQAFYTLENARRNRFDTKEFDDAFLRYFGGFSPLDNSKAEEAKYLNLRRSAPDDIKIIFHLADIYVSRADYASAEPLLRLILDKDPEHFSSVAALAEIYRRQNKPDKEKEILADFEKNYPTAASSYIMQIRRLMDSEPAKARKLLDEAVIRYPNDGNFWFYMAVLADREKQIVEAEQHFIKAAELEKNSVTIQGYTAAFFRAEKRDNKTALDYYLNTYFLDPHAHIDGFAEAKISSLNYELSRAKVEKHLADGNNFEDLLADPNPIVVALTIGKIAEKWDTSKIDLLVGLMRHNDSAVRWYAMEALKTKVRAQTFDKRLMELLRADDLRVRGLAAYIAVHLWKERSFPELRKMLDDEAQVLRFDAVSALLMEGGVEGKKIVLQHKSKEPSVPLRKMIEHSFEKAAP
jgi:Tfp pilus assembly protein PilF